MDGLSLSLVAPQELPRWSALMRALAREQLPRSFPVDSRLVGLAQQRVTLARKVGVWGEGGASVWGCALASSEWIWHATGWVWVVSAGGLVGDYAGFRK